jgi:arylsulfatase A-like enzyme
MKRRDFIKGTMAASVLGGCGSVLGEELSSTRAALTSQPNILVIVVDEMRPPPGYPDNFDAAWLAAIPRLAALWAKSACFTNHFTAASDCSPARATLITGLYAQQHWLLSTRVTPLSPVLQTAYPTYGTILTGLGYTTTWFGKWHLSDTCAGQLASYGFAGGTCPDPDGSAGQGTQDDPGIAAQFVAWLQGQSPSSGPWCTTVSFVNPHDIQWFFAGTDCGNGAAEGESQTSAVAQCYYDQAYFAQWGGNPCANFENPNSTSTPKPAMQLQFALELTGATWGEISWSQSSPSWSWPRLQCPAPWATPSCPAPLPPTQMPFDYWYKLTQLYYDLHHNVDGNIGIVLDALAASSFAEDTIVVFVSDHGEYLGAHGQRGKGGMAYDEGMNIPLSVYDPTGQFVASPTTARTGLTSSVDFTSMLATIANGGSTSWNAAYPYLQQRFDLTRMLANPSAPGRLYVLYTTDEVYPNISPNQYNTHVIAYRTSAGKLGVYSGWQAGTVTIDPNRAQELEVYDYNQETRLNQAWEVPNVQSTSALTEPYYAALFGVGGAGGLFGLELQGTLPAAYQAAQQTAINEYLLYVPVTEIF